MTKKSFFSSLIVDIATLAAIVPVAAWTLSSVVKNTYEEFFVIGSSMQPTLFGETTKSSYGRCDKSSQAIDNLKRFDIVVCYYPFANSDYKQPYVKGESELYSNASLKVKRVIGLPGDKLSINNETFTIENEKIGSVTYGPDHEKVPFERATPIDNRVANITLGEDEYFVMGDNWTANGSTDCCNPGSYTFFNEPQPIYRENISGVVINLEGFCTYGKFYSCSSCNATSKTQQCPKCGTTLFNEFEDIVSRTPFEDGPQYLL